MGREDWTEEQTGRGGSLGAPDLGAGDIPDSGDVEEREAVSGGGVVDHEEAANAESPEGTTEVD